MNYPVIPLARNADGAILGVDFRRSELAPEGMRVPGRVPARAVMPGDTLVAHGARVVVQKLGRHEGNVVIHTLTAAGTPIVLVRPEEMRVGVVAVGAFDR